MSSPKYHGILTKFDYCVFTWKVRVPIFSEENRIRSTMTQHQGLQFCPPGYMFLVVLDPFIADRQHILIAETRIDFLISHVVSDAVVHPTTTLLLILSLPINIQFRASFDSHVSNKKDPCIIAEVLGSVKGYVRLIF